MIPATPIERIILENDRRGEKYPGRIPQSHTGIRVKPILIMIVHAEMRDSAGGLGSETGAESGASKGARVRVWDLSEAITDGGVGGKERQRSSC